MQILLQMLGTNTSTENTPTEKSAGVELADELEAAFTLSLAASGDPGIADGEFSLISDEPVAAGESKPKTSRLNESLPFGFDQPSTPIAVGLPDEAAARVPFYSAITSFGPVRVAGLPRLDTLLPPADQPIAKSAAKDVTGSIKEITNKEVAKAPVPISVTTDAVLSDKPVPRVKLDKGIDPPLTKNPVAAKVTLEKPLVSQAQPDHRTKEVATLETDVRQKTPAPLQESLWQKASVLKGPTVDSPEFELASKPNSPAPERMSKEAVPKVGPSLPNGLLNIQKSAPSDREIAEPVRAQSSDRPAPSMTDSSATNQPLSGRLASTPVEIFYRPNAMQKVATNPAEIEIRKSVTVAETVKEKVPLKGDMTLSMIREPSRREDKSALPQPRHANADMDIAPQTLANARQRLPIAQPLDAIVFSPTLKTTGIETSSVSETTHTREGGFQISSDVSGLRKDIGAPPKAEPIARPVLQQLTQAAKTLGDGSVEIRLAPEELGRVRLSISPGETHVTVHIGAERPETADLIRRNIELFSHSLKQEGFTNLSFSFGDSDSDRGGAQDGETLAHLFDETANTDETSTQKPTPQNHLAGRLDIRI